MIAIIVALVFCVIFAVNVFVDLSLLFHDESRRRSSFLATSGYDQSLGKWLSLYNMPLTYDCPIIIAINIFGFTLCNASPFLFGKSYFLCTDNNTVLAEEFPRDNWHCYVLGSFTFIFIHAAYWYLCLLSFAIFRYLYKPDNPLFKVCMLLYTVRVRPCTV